MPNHLYGYYTIYALPAFIALILILLQINNHYKPVLIFIAVTALANIIFANLTYSSDFSTPNNQDNVLIKKAAIVSAIFNGLKEKLPTIDNDASIIINGVDLQAIGGNKGVQFLYHNNSIHAYDGSNLKYSNGIPYIYKDSRELGHYSISKIN